MQIYLFSKIMLNYIVEINNLTQQIIIKQNVAKKDREQTLLTIYYMTVYITVNLIR